jgi:hypothetical protein
LIDGGGVGVRQHEKSMSLVFLQVNRKKTMSRTKYPGGS